MNCLDLTLYPSLTLTLVEKSGETYVKRFGVRKGVNVADDPHLSGRWFDPRRYIGDLSKDVEESVTRLLERYAGCVGLSISPGDEGLIFVAAFLTQNTSYHTNVLKWTRALFSRSEDLNDIAEAAPALGNSYQLKMLPEALREYLSTKPRTRSDLVRIRGVGAKVADLYLLFTGDTTAVPVDKHFIRYAPQLGLKGVPPRAELCARYVCEECPLRRNCLRAQASEKMGRLAGWVQTVVWLISTHKEAKARSQSEAR